MAELYTNREIFQKLINYINNDMHINRQEYDIILNILKNYDAKLFVRILSEVANNQLSWLDFKQILPVDSDKLASLIENQENIYQQIVLLNQIADSNQQLYDNLITNYKHYTQKEIVDEHGLNKTINVIDESAELIEKENQVMSLINNSTGDILTDLYNSAVIKKIIESDDSDFIDSMLLSVHDYLVPVDYNLIQLTNFDIEFAYKNKISLETMKKIKSLAAFSSNYYDTNFDETLEQ